MHRFMDNDFVLGKLFLKLIEKKQKTISFKQIFDFLYYASVKLDEKGEKDTIILVSKDGIYDFCYFYCDYLKLDEKDSEIVISIENPDKLQKFLKARFSNKDSYSDVFDYALEKTLKAA